MLRTLLFKKPSGRMLFSTSAPTAPTTSAEAEKIIADMQREFRSLYAAQDYSPAIDLAIELDKITLDFYGEEHPVTASSTNNHALLKRAIGEYETAVELFTTAIQRYEKSVGKEHTSTATALHNLGLTYKSMYESGDFTGVEELHLQDRAEEALRESLSRRAPEHIDRATTMYVLAAVRSTQGKGTEESADLFKDAVHLLRESHTASKTSRASGIRLATGLNNWGYWLKTEGDFNDALEKYQESFELREKHAGENDVNAIVSLQNIAELLTSMSCEEEADEVRKEIMRRVELLQ